MKWKDTGGENVDFEPAPAGTHLGICYQIIDLGTHENKLYENWRRQVYLGFELPNETREWEDQDGNKQTAPFAVGKFYTMSLNEKANLRKDLVSWRGRDFTEEELDGFDPRNVLGKPCLLTVTHKEREGRKPRANIASIGTMMKGMEVPEQTNPSVFFSLENFSRDAFEKVPEGFQKMIKESLEWRERGLGEEERPPEQEDGFQDNTMEDVDKALDGIKDNSDIPF